MRKTNARKVKHGQSSSRKKENGPPTGLDLDKPLSKSTIQAIQNMAKDSAVACAMVFSFTPRNGLETFAEAAKMYPKSITGLQDTIDGKYETDHPGAQEYLKSHVRGFWVHAPLNWGATSKPDASLNLLVR